MGLFRKKKDNSIEEAIEAAKEKARSTPFDEESLKKYRKIHISEKDRKRLNRIASQALKAATA